MTSPAGSTEPTAEQYGQAGAIVYTVLSGVGGYGSLLDPDKTTRNVARALAAAVTAERKRLRQLIDDVIVDNGLTCHPFPSNNPCQCSTARAIREVAG